MDIPDLPPVAPDVAAPLNLVLNFPNAPPLIAPAPLNLVLNFANPPPLPPDVAAPLNLVLEFPNPPSVPPANICGNLFILIIV